MSEGRIRNRATRCRGKQGASGKMYRPKSALITSIAILAAAFLTAWPAVAIVTDAVAADGPSWSDSENPLADVGPHPAKQHPWLEHLLTWDGNRDDAQGDKEEDEPLESDRPNFTNGPTTVGLGRVQLESGYTYTQAVNGDPRHWTHTLPEALLRYGVTERLELRLRWDGAVFDAVQNRDSDRVARRTGYTDVKPGFKYTMTKTQGWRPATGLIVAVSAPAGTFDQSSREVDCEIDFVYRWDITKRLVLAGSTGNLCTCETNEHQTKVNQSAVLEYSLTEKLNVFNEWYVICPKDSADDHPRHYYDGGVTYLIAPNLQVDWRAGVGLSRVSDGLFTGCGVVLRK
jgi:hypothetical protein